MVVLRHGLLWLLLGLELGAVGLHWLLWLRLVLIVRWSVILLSHGRVLRWHGRHLIDGHLSLEVILVDDK